MTMWIDLFYPIFSGLTAAAMEFTFFSRLAGDKAGRGAGRYLFFLAACLACFLQAASSVKLLLFTCILSLYGFWILKADAATSFFCAVMTATLTLLCYGVFNSVSTILAAFFFRKDSEICGLLFMICADLSSLLLSFLCYRAVLQVSDCGQMLRSPPAFVFLPLLFVFLVSEYAGYVVYGNIASVGTPSASFLIGHIRLFFLQAFAVISIFCILLACQSLSAKASLSERLWASEQRQRLLGQYVDKARAGYENTRAFRHDLKNHLLVVRGLLERHACRQALAYMAQVESLASECVLPFHTNCPALDILIGNKAGLAAADGIETVCSLALPVRCPIDEADLCIIVANALDNAVCACRKLPEGAPRYIHISGHMQGELLFLEIVNSARESRVFCPGTGLRNIRRVVQKYGGTMSVNTEGGVFSLRALLIISQRP